MSYVLWSVAAVAVAVTVSVALALWCTAGAVRAERRAERIARGEDSQNV